MPTLMWAILVMMACLVPWSSRGAHVKPPADIVYSARYYKPGKEVSQYHLWRINPDGSGRVQVTSDIKAADHSPLWLADGHTILFVREEGGLSGLCSVSENGGPVTTFAPTPGDQIGIRSLSPDRRFLVFSVANGDPKLYLMDVASKSYRPLGAGWNAALSPGGQVLYRSEYTKGKPSLIMNLVSGKQLPLPDNLRAGAWLDNNLLVAEVFVPQPGQPRLCLVRTNGTIEREIPLPFNWGDDLSPFADDLFSIPGDRDSVLYGRHAGESSGGPAHQFYKVDLKTGKTTLLADGRDVAWSPDKRSFCTGDGRDLAPFSGKHQVWVSPLHIVSLEDGSRRTIVEGLVSVGGFDWRSPAAVEKTTPKQP